MLPISDALPGGFLGTVSSASEDGRTILLTAGALDDAFDYYDVSVDQFGTAPDPTTSASAANGTDSLSFVQSIQPTSTSVPLSTLAAPAGLTDCIGGSGSGRIEYSPQLDLGGRFSATIDKYGIAGADVPHGASLDMALWVRAMGPMTIETSGSLQCDILDIGKVFTTIVPGPVPIGFYYSPKFEINTESAVSVEEAGYVATGGIAFAGTFGLDGADFSGDAILKAESLPPETTFSGSVGAKLSGQIVVGPGAGTPDSGVIAGVGGDLSPIVATVGPYSALANCVAASLAFERDTYVTAKAWLGNWDYSEQITFDGAAGSRDYPGSPWYFPDNCDNPPTTEPPDVDPGDNDGDPTDPTPSPTPAPPGNPTAFTYRPDADSWGGIWPAPDGGWLVATNTQDTEWAYSWLSPRGERTTTWDAHYDPVSVVAGPNADILMIGHDRRGDNLLSLVRATKEGVVVRKDFDPDPRFPSVQVLAMGKDGYLYWYAPLADGLWLLQLDPHTLDVLHRRRFWVDSAAMNASASGLTIVGYPGVMYHVPYSAFSDAAEGTQLNVPGVQRTHSGTDIQVSIGADGAVADMTTWPSDCTSVTTSNRSVDGSAWTKSIEDVIAAPLPGCAVEDIDALPDGRTVYTLRSDSSVALLWVSSDGEQQHFTTLPSVGFNADTIVDDSGLVVTSFTELYDCAAAEPTTHNRCSKLIIVGHRDGAIVIDKALAGPNQVLSYNAASLGRPIVAFGEGQIIAEVVDSPPHSCTTDNCTPHGAMREYRSILADTHVTTHPSFTWW